MGFHRLHERCHRLEELNVRVNVKDMAARKAGHRLHRPRLVGGGHFGQVIGKAEIGHLRGSKLDLMHPKQTDAPPVHSFLGKWTQGMVIDQQHPEIHAGMMRLERIHKYKCPGKIIRRNDGACRKRST